MERDLIPRMRGRPLVEKRVTHVVHVSFSPLSDMVIPLIQKSRVDIPREL